MASLDPEHVLQAIAKLGQNAGLRDILRSTDVSKEIQEAARAIILSTGNVLGSEGHRTQLRYKLQASALHYGHSTLFITPNLADGRASLLLHLHLGPRDHTELQRELRTPIPGMEEYRIDLLAEAPRMPPGDVMLRIIAMDSVAQTTFSTQ